MKCPIEIIRYMHEYLDEDIDSIHEEKLREHLRNCEECMVHFHELKKNIALVQSTSHIQAPDMFTQNVMNMLPKERKRATVKRWLRHHPIVTAASLFFVLMASSLFSNWNEDKEFSVSKEPNLIVQNDVAIVPEGEVVKGNIVVRNGNIKIEGEVDGNVTVINGEKYMASAGQVTGEIEEVNEVFDWVWYYMKKTFQDVVQVFEQKENDSKDTTPAY